MLFTTAPFLLLFLPITLIGFFAFGRWRPRHAATWLLLASLFFYGYWMPTFVGLLLTSIGLNYLIAQRIVENFRLGLGSLAKRWLCLGLAVNLLILAYYKYANFLVDNLNVLAGTGWHLADIILPIGISFYTFTQIAYLVDAYEGKVNETNPLHFGLFVTYFPHLIAGPVLHHAQMMPQFADQSIYKPRVDNLVAGLAILTLGLFKKVVMADGLAPYADAVFTAADAGLQLESGEAWLGSVAYALQLYFDFSGYSDMAIGLSCMFNVKLPFNFSSPYQARNISDFWRCWHMSLSQFLRDYLYVPLGGNRLGSARRYLNLGITMLLGGLWHGASWSFVVWGALHGVYLTINHGFRALLGERLRQRLADNAAYSLVSWAMTLVAVLLAWVFFRAQTLGGALHLISTMVIGPTLGSEPAGVLWNAGLAAPRGWIWCGALGAVALFAANSNRAGQQLMSILARHGWLAPLMAGASVSAAGLLLLVNVARDSTSAFIYFNF